MTGWNLLVPLKIRNFISKAGLLLKKQRARSGTPNLFVCFRVHTPIPSFKSVFGQLDVAGKIGFVAVALDETLLAGFDGSVKLVAVAFKDHRTVIASRDRIRGNGPENVGIATRPRKHDRIVQSVILDVNAIAAIDETVNSLAVGRPKIVVVGLLRIEANVVKKLERKRPKENANVGVGFRVGKRLLAVAEVSGHPACQRV